MLRPWEADLSAFGPQNTEKRISTSFEAFPQVHADKAGKRANLGTFR
jgi:hypothetical protein